MSNGVFPLPKEKTQGDKNLESEPMFIQLGLMNGETIKIHIMDIACLQIFGVSENHYLTNDYPILEKHKFCSRTYIKLTKDVGAKKCRPNSSMTIQERLTKFNDISDITYLNEAGHYLDRILVPWSDMTCDGQENDHQFCRVDRQGNIEIFLKGTNHYRYAN